MKILILILLPLVAAAAALPVTNPSALVNRDDNNNNNNLSVCNLNGYNTRNITITFFPNLFQRLSIPKAA
jgi:hypothetical protein